MKHKKIYHFQEGTNFWRIIKPYLHYSSIITSTPTRSRPYSVNAYNVHIISNIEDARYFRTPMVQNIYTILETKHSESSNNRYIVLLAKV